ncbi:MAG: lysophospholipid acyltransferase family protein, partial [Candidatus Neomarinimicrobiota bacterium]|nr:lysophospholipid acyltransferase family protein [Candidatus Neomarinimicrobiota bacterium]
MRYLLGYLAMFLCSLGSRVKIFGRHHVPDEGPYIVVINHFSYIDPPFVIHALQKPISFLAASDQVIEAQFIWAPFLYGFIPTDRTNLAPSTIKNSIRALKNGEVLGVFPEGTSLSRVLRPAKNGAAFLSATAKTHLLPVGIIGLESAWENIFRGVRPTVQVRIGKPFGPFTLSKSKKNKERDLNKIGDEIMCKIAALLP